MNANRIVCEHEKQTNLNEISRQKLELDKCVDQLQISEKKYKDYDQDNIKLSQELEKLLPMVVESKRQQERLDENVCELAKFHDIISSKDEFIQELQIRLTDAVGRFEEFKKKLVDESETKILLFKNEIGDFEHQELLHMEILADKDRELRDLGRQLEEMKNISTESDKYRDNLLKDIEDLARLIQLKETTIAESQNERLVLMAANEALRTENDKLMNDICVIENKFSNTEANLNSEISDMKVKLEWSNWKLDQSLGRRGTGVRKSQSFGRSEIENRRRFSQMEFAEPLGNTKNLTEKSQQVRISEK